MKFGKFEITEIVIFWTLIVFVIVMFLHFVVKEQEIKEKTKQLELQKEIIYMEQKNNI